MNTLLKTLLIFCVSCSVQAKSWQFGDKNEVNFSGTTTADFLNIQSSGGKLEGTIVGDQKGFEANLKVDLRNLKVRPELRNKHMHEIYLETKKFPYAQLKISRKIAFKLSEKFDWEGLFTLKGKTNKVKGNASFDGKTLIATFPVSLDEYPIGLPKFAGLVMARDVAVEVEVELK